MGKEAETKIRARENEKYKEKSETHKSEIHKIRDIFRERKIERGGEREFIKERIT